MKRLLLSTTLMLGTLTGVKAADLTPASAETIQRSITEVETRVDQLSAKIADLPAQIDLHTQVARALSPISADVAKLKTELATLTSKVDALDGTLQQRLPALHVAVTERIDIDAELRGALDHPTILMYQANILNKLEQELKTLSIDPSLLNSRRQNVEGIVRGYLDNIIDYSPSPLASLFTVNTLALTTMLLIVYDYLWKTETTPKDRFAIAAPMGGGSTLATSTIAIAGIYSLIRDRILFSAYNYFNLSTYVAKLYTTVYYFLSLLFENDNYYLHTLNHKWARGELSNPQVKAYFTKVLSAGWILKDRADSTKTIRTSLRNALLESKEIKEILRKIFNLNS